MFLNGQFTPKLKKLKKKKETIKEMRWHFALLNPIVQYLFSAD